MTDHEARARAIVDPLLFMTAQKPMVLEVDELASAIAKALSEETAVLESRNKRLREKYRKGYSSGFSDGYLQAEFDCDAMGAEAFLRQADGLRRSQASILNKQDARISSLEEQTERIAELQHDADRQRSIANEHVNDNIAKRIRIAELEAALRSAIKSHDKVPENIPMPKWVEGARAVLGGIKVIDPPPEAIAWAEGVFAEEDDKAARIAELEATVAKAFLRCQALEEAVKPFAELGEKIKAGNIIPLKADGLGPKMVWVTAFDCVAVHDVLCHAAPVPGCETSSAEGQEY